MGRHRDEWLHVHGEEAQPGACPSLYLLTNHTHVKLDMQGALPKHQRHTTGAGWGSECATRGGGESAVCTQPTPLLPPLQSIGIVKQVRNVANKMYVAECMRRNWDAQPLHQAATFKTQYHVALSTVLPKKSRCGVPPGETERRLLLGWPYRQGLGGTHPFCWTLPHGSAGPRETPSRTPPPTC